MQTDTCWVQRQNKKMNARKTKDVVLQKKDKGCVNVDEEIEG